jgi:hypothetical protein
MKCIAGRNVKKGNQRGKNEWETRVRTPETVA